MSAWLRAFLGLVTGMLWITLVFVIIMAFAYVGVLVAIGGGWLDPNALHARGIKIHVDEAEVNVLAWQTITAFFAGSFIALPTTILIVRRLKAMFDTFVIDDPFRAENGVHLRVIALGLIVLQFVGAIEYYVETLLHLVTRPAHGEFNVSLSLDSHTLTVWFVIAVLFVLAEVFREGARMRDEQNLTV